MLVTPAADLAASQAYRHTRGTAVSFDKKDDKLKTAWIWIAFIIVILGAILFTTYWWMLGPISHDHAAWSSFGSLLSGFFMVASTAATVATLLFLAHQNRQIQKTNEDQQKVTEKQLAAVNFEQYVNHRRYFMERLSGLQSAFGNRFVFEDTDDLYNKVFPKNSPTNLEFTAEVISVPATQNYLGKFRYQLDKLAEFSKSPEWERNGGRRLIGLLIDLSSTLNVRMVGEAFDGDVKFGNKMTFINIYSPDEFIEFAKSVFNSFVFYTGNEKFNGLERPMQRSASDSLMKFFLTQKQEPALIEICKKAPGLEIMEKIYFNLCVMKHVDFWLMQPTYATLMNAFSSRTGVMQLQDKDFVDQLADVGCCAASTALNQSSEADDGYELIKQTHELFNLLLARNA